MRVLHICTSGPAARVAAPRECSLASAAEAARKSADYSRPIWLGTGALAVSVPAS